MLTPYDCLKATEYSNDSKYTKLEKKLFYCLYIILFIHFSHIKKNIHKTQHIRTHSPTAASTTVIEKYGRRRRRGGKKLYSVYQNMYTRYKHTKNKEL